MQKRSQIECLVSPVMNICQRRAHPHPFAVHMKFKPCIGAHIHNKLCRNTSDGNHFAKVDNIKISGRSIRPCNPLRCPGMRRMILHRGSRNLRQPAKYEPHCNQPCSPSISDLHAKPPNLTSNQQNNGQRYLPSYPSEIPSLTSGNRTGFTSITSNRCNTFLASPVSGTIPNRLVRTHSRSPFAAGTARRSP